MFQLLDNDGKLSINLETTLKIISFRHQASATQKKGRINQSEIMDKQQKR